MMRFLVAIAISSSAFSAASYGATASKAPEVRVSSNGDLAVGRPFEIDVSCRIEAGDRVTFPDAPIDRGAVLFVSHRDGGGEASVASRRYEVLPAISGDVVLPAIECSLQRADGSREALRTEPLRITVASRGEGGKPPTALDDAFDLFDPEKRSRGSSVVAFLGLALAAILFVVRRRRLAARRLPTAAPIHASAPFPGTLAVLARLRQQLELLEQGSAEGNEIASRTAIEAASAVRGALAERLRLPASRRTTEELTRRLEELDLEKDGDVALLLELADEVKYGGAKLDRARARIALDAADRAIAWIGPLPAAAVARAAEAGAAA